MLDSLPTSQGRFLHHNRLQVVSYQWLEDSLKKMMKLPENLYSLKSELVEALNIKRYGNELTTLCFRYNIAHP